MMLGDGNMRMNGKHALLSVQQKHEEFVKHLWNICNKYGILMNPVKKLIRTDKKYGTIKTSYVFQTFTLPYFTKLYNKWYQNVGKLTLKVIPADIDKILTPLAIAYWVAGDGTFDKSRSRVFLCTDNFTKEECKQLQIILLNKFGIETYLKLNGVKSKDQYRIVIPKRELKYFQNLILDYLHPSMYYRIGL
jgi:hypothetical protein